MARFAATVLFPTPPLPLTTAMMFFTPGSIVLASCLADVVLLVKLTCTFAALFTKSFMAFSLAFAIISFMGQAGVVSMMVKLTASPFIFISFTIPRVTRSLPRSGSSTFLSASNIACSVISIFC